MINRRQFSKGIVAVALSGLASHLRATSITGASSDVTSNIISNPLIPDVNAILDLPEGFSYQIISTLNDVMNDGIPVPDCADGMGCIPLDAKRVTLIRNHELPLSNNPEQVQTSVPANTTLRAYDKYRSGVPLTGGTSNIVYNLQTQQVEHQCMSLLGTIRNCSGGVTPWGSWLSCEESVDKASDQISKDHGYVFEVPSSARELIEPTPIKTMGRFNHEAVCVDPQTGTVYLTEDRQDSLFYRYIPTKKENLQAGGKLQALKVSNQPQFDTRNSKAPYMQEDQTYSCEWLDLDNVDSPNDDLRQQGLAKGAALFARGEGIHFNVNEMYFCCTSGGKKKLGQIMHYKPTPMKQNQKPSEQAGTLTLFVESHNETTFNFGDNIAVAPSGHLMVCEDSYSATVNNHLRGVTPQGKIYDFAKVRWQTEPAGVCFSPDGSVLFVNLYSPTTTLAIRGPWDKLYAKN